jgi:thiol-disulfide isomerase/thioredoxin
MQNKNIIGFIVAIIVILGLVVFFTSRGTGGTVGPDLTLFAQCIKNSGATFYGAFWCPHCQATKKMFGSAQKELPYVECSTPDGQGQLPNCTSMGIKQYPTWILKDGTRQTGELTLAQISSMTSCPLPGAATSSASILPPAASQSSSAAVSSSSKATSSKSKSSPVR